VRYYGRYSSRTRGAEDEHPGHSRAWRECREPRAPRGEDGLGEDDSQGLRGRPLACPQRGAQMRVIALIGRSDVP